MSRTRKESLSDKAKELEHELSKHKAVLAMFPNAKYHYWYGYTSNMVNNLYTGFSFEKQYSGLYVVPYCEVEVTFDGKTEFVKVHAEPRMNKLVHMTRDRKNGTWKPMMKLAKFALNLENHGFKDDMLNSCRAEIMNYIKDHAGIPLDKKHLEPRLQKLLLFT